MADRSIAFRLEAVYQYYVQGFKEATKATQELGDAAKKTDQATKDGQKSADDRARSIKAVAEADQRAAKVAGLLYNAQGRLVDANGKVLSSTQAAAHGLDSFSEAAYLANREAEESAEATTAAVEKQREAWKTLAPAVTVVGGAISLAFGTALKTFADFDQSMSEVQAATHESAGNMSLLREEAISAGADTAFSAKEAALGIKELAKAGVDTESIINGGLSGALDLAATDNLAVAKAAEIAASAMTQFKLSGEQVPHIADLLAAGAGKAQGSVEDLGMALNQSGLVANGTGLSIEETTGALAAFASAGLTGSDAGTSFKTMLQSLTPNSDKAATIMDELGVSAYDAQGSFIGMAEYAGLLQGALKDMSEEQRQATLKTLFGSDAVRAATVLYEQGEEGIRNWEAAVNDAGYAAETAAAMQDNLAGDLEKLGGAFDTVFLKSGSGANDVLRGFVQGAESLVDMIGQIPEPVLSIGGILTGLVGGTALAGGAIVTFVPKVRETVEAFKDLQSTGSRVPGVIGKVGKAAAVAGIALGTFQIAAQLAGTGLDDLGDSADYIDKLTDGTKDLEVLKRRVNELATASGTSQTSIRGMGDAISVLNQPGIAKAMDWVGSVGGIFDSDAKLATKAVTEYDTALKAMLDSGAQAEASQGFKIAADQAKDYGVGLDQVMAQFPEYIGGLEAQAEAAGVSLSKHSLLRWAMYDIEPAGIAAARGAEQTEQALQDVGVSAEGAVENMEDFLDILFEAGVITRDERAALREYEAAIDEIGESIKTNGKSLDVHTEKGRANQAAFDALAQSGEDYVRALAAGGASEEELQSAMTSTYESLITAAEQFGITGEKADKMAREIMGIPEDVKVESWMSDAAKKTAEQTKTAVEEIPKRHDVKIVQTFETHGVPFKPQNPITKQLQESQPKVNFPGLASGGDLDSAPGPVGVDSMLFYGAKGEHVFTAAEVAAMGGQQAVYRFRSQLRSGQIRGHAAGGEVGTSSASIMQYTVPAAGASGTTISIGDIIVQGAGDPERAAKAVEDRITRKFAKEGMRFG
ncbi:phage tail tape measure protein [Glutamicibacter sp. PS]|uniref:phage tail tape measure protein n=1 Tax=Glutamicibacter sp. PS TaxID=3075634 RepID=UPI00284BA56D|nr:phage tail tape measure protein [Glutamicibacter sp. PS]MDR4533208.1 phage tail tape measure protein [Glutamicibacter sp. PS]